MSHSNKHALMDETGVGSVTPFMHGKNYIHKHKYLYMCIHNKHVASLGNC